MSIVLSCTRKPCRQQPNIVQPPLLKIQDGNSCFCQAKISMPAKSDVFIRFDAEKNQAGSVCNRFTTKYNREGSKLQAGPFAVTCMICPPDQMAVENVFLKALQDAHGFAVSGDRFKLMKGNVLPAEFEQFITDR